MGLSKHEIGWAIWALFALMIVLGLVEAARYRRIRFCRWTYALDTQPGQFWGAVAGMVALIAVAFAITLRVR